MHACLIIKQPNTPPHHTYIHHALHTLRRQAPGTGAAGGAERGRQNQEPFRSGIFLWDVPVGTADGYVCVCVRVCACVYVRVWLSVGFLTQGHLFCIGYVCTCVSPRIFFIRLVLLNITHFLTLNTALYQSHRTPHTQSPGLTSCTPTARCSVRCTWTRRGFFPRTTLANGLT
jgi:hypothetical protein